jgi:hypothetical protein
MFARLKHLIFLDNEVMALSRLPRAEFQTINLAKIENMAALLAPLPE